MEKLIFDGPNKRISLESGITSFSVKNDLYSGWKRWASLSDNTKYLPAIRTIGGDAVGGGLYAGDIYFLMNGWQIYIDQNIKVIGTLYHDDPIDTYIILSGGGVTASVSNLAYAYNTTGVIVPTVQEIRSEIDTNSSQLALIKASTDSILIDSVLAEVKLAQIQAILATMPGDTASSVWSAPVSGMTDTNTIGGWIYKKILTIPKFLGLK